MRLLYVGLLLTAWTRGSVADGDFNCLSRCTCHSNTVTNCSYMGYREMPQEKLNIKVKDLDFSHNQLTSLEKTSMDIMSIGALNYLNLSHNEIEYINMEAFHLCVRLTQLDLSWNRIQFFNRKTIEFTPLLERLSLAGNPRIYLSNTGGFLESTSLTHLNMSWSELGLVPDVTFEDLFHLRHLDLSHNRLTRLRPEVFSKLSQLEWLDLSYNHLDSGQLRVLTSHFPSNVTVVTDPQRASHCTWPSDSLANCSGKDITNVPVVGFTPTITDVDLSHNKLTRLTKEGVDRLGKVIQLHNLNFSHNLIEHIDEDAFKEGLHWLEVDLSWNRLMFINPNTFLHNYYLEKVSLAGNTQLVLIPSGNFLRAGPLLHLNMSHCGLSNIPYNTFSSTRQLQTLDLSYNNLTALPSKALSELFQLNLLDVSYNQLENLDINSLSRLLNYENSAPEIRNRRKRDVATTIVLRIEGNPWLCDCQMLEVYEWCQRNRLHLPVICQSPHHLSQLSWEALASENCSSESTHGYSSTDSPVSVSMSLTMIEIMWSVIVIVVFVISILCFIAVICCNFKPKCGVTNILFRGKKKDDDYMELK